MSVPWPIAQIPAATEAAPPPDDPPGVSPVLRGFSVWPCSELRVNQRIENAGVLVLPTTMAPAWRRLVTTGLSCSAIRSCWIRIPLVLAKPRWSMLTLIVTGTAASRPPSSPAARRSSSAAASASACSGISCTTALIFGLIDCSRCRLAWITSVAEISRFLTRAAISDALRRQDSVIVFPRSRGGHYK